MAENINWTTAYALKNTGYYGNSTTVDTHGTIQHSNRYPWWHITLASIVVTCIIIIIVLGNALVIVAIAKDKNLKQLQNWFIASLAVSDLLLGLLIMPFSLTNELMGYWYFGNVLCEMWLSIDVLLCTASILNLCLISLDRYWSITRAVSYVKHRTKKKATIMITLVWILSAIICFPPLVGWKRPQPSHSGVQHCVLSQEIGYVVYSTLGSFFIPLLVMVVVYFKIYLAARARARRHLNKNKSTIKDNAPTTTTSLATRTFRNSVEKLKSNGNESSKPGNDFTSLSPSDSCQEGVLPETNSADNDKTIPLSQMDSSKCNNKNSFTNNRYNDCSNRRLEEEQKRLLGDDTDATESGSELTKRQHAVSDTNDVVVTVSQAVDTTLTLSKPVSDYSPMTEVTCACKESSNSNNSADHLKITENCRSRKSTSEQRGSDVALSGVLSENIVSTPFSNTNCMDSMNNDPISRTANCSHDCEKNNTSFSTSVVNEGINKRTQPSIKVIKSRTGESTNILSQTDIKSYESSPRISRKDLLSPDQTPYVNNKATKSKKRNKDVRKAANEPERLKRKIARARERRATLVLGIIMATFILCWLPFFGTYLISTLAGLMVPDAVFAIMFWAGYCNSALNPIIYTIFNQDFRKAFQRILCKKRRR